MKVGLKLEQMKEQYKSQFSPSLLSQQSLSCFSILITSAYPFIYAESTVLGTLALRFAFPVESQIEIKVTESSTSFLRCEY